MMFALEELLCAYRPKEVHKSGRGSKGLSVIQPPSLTSTATPERDSCANLTFLVLRFTALHVEPHDNKYITQNKELE
jgi:hypothetical protein